MPDLGKAYVQIVPSAKGMGNGIKKELEGTGAESGGGFGSAFASAAKKIIAVAAIGKAVKASLDAGGALQQSFGGLDTLYEDAAYAAKRYAYAAAQAGISANDYAEQAVSFGAGLKEAFGGNTTKAMQAANTAILDMADNAAKMGTPIENIQNAYQGFAKQNYTMLDNLKLGYGGTKSEMERLLADAEKFSGVKYDINNLGDVYAAIHAIQDKLNLTGVAAGEAKSTFTGSFAAMKASATNFLANLSLGEDITMPFQQMVESAKNFLLGNLVPMVGNIIKQLPTLLNELSSTGTQILEQIVSGIRNNTATIAETVKNFVVNFTSSLAANISLLIQAGIEITKALIEGLSQVDWKKTGSDILNALKNGINSISKSILGDGKTLDDFLAGINDKLPYVLNAGISIIGKAVEGIMQALPGLIEKAGSIILSFGKALIDAAPTLIRKGGELLSWLLKGISEGLPQIGTKVGEIIGKFTRYFVEHYPEIIQAGFELIGKLIAGIIKAIPKVLEALFNLGESMALQFDDIDWKEVGSNILNGVLEGLKAVGSLVWDAVKSVGDSIWKDFCSYFGIASPSKKMAGLGNDLLRGIVNGLKDANILGTLATAATGIYNTIIGKLTNSGFVQKGKDMASAVKTGLEDSGILNQIGGAALGLVNAALNAANLTSDQKNKFFAAGSGLAGELISGLNSKEKELDNTIAALVNKAANAATNAAAHTNNLSALYAKMGGSLTAEADMYGDYGDSNTDIIIDLLARYLPMIVANDNYSQINRSLGLGLS